MITLFDDAPLVRVVHRQVERLTKKGSDYFQTPAYALEPLYPYLRREWRLWEPAAGKLQIVHALEFQGYDVTASDVKTGYDFLDPRSVPSRFDAVVTNPPFSIKNAFLSRCFDLGKPFALILPYAALGTASRQTLYRRHGVELIFMDKRVHFDTPSGVESSAWFDSVWLTHGLNIGREITWFTFGETTLQGELWDDALLLEEA